MIFLTFIAILYDVLFRNTGGIRMNDRVAESENQAMATAPSVGWPDLEEKDLNGWTPLSRKAFDGDQKDVKQLIDRGANIETRALNGCTPLIIASFQGHTSVVQLLLESGADIETKSDTGYFPLLFAAQEGHEKVVRLLLNREAAIEGRDSLGRTPLLIASFQGHTNVVQLLLKSGADIETKSDAGFFPLYIAAREGHEQVVRLLLNRGADIEARHLIEHDRTPLSIASLNGHVSVVQLLLEYGAYIETKSDMDSSPLFLAAQEGHEHVVRLLLNRGADIEARSAGDFTPLSQASFKGHINLVQLLLESGADIETKANGGFSPLNIAAQEGHKQIARLLLYSGADMETRNSTGSTPLVTASGKGHTDVVHLLLESHADIETKVQGATALYFATQQGHDQVVRLLLDRGADIEASDSDGATSLHKASEKGNTGIVQMLLESGADIEKKKNNHSFRPLHIAAQQGLEQTVELLLNWGADIEATSCDLSHKTCLHMACARGHTNVVQLLLANGANIEARDSHGHTPMSKACLHGHIDTVQLLLESGADIESEQRSGLFCLYWAALEGHEQVVRVLLQKGAKIDTHPWSPLHAALRHGHIEVATLLIKNGVDISREDSTLNVPLTFAAMHGQVDAAKLLIEHGADCESRCNNGLSALDNSVIHGQVNTVEFFMKRITDEEKRRAVAEQMVSLAAENGQKDVISFLLKFVKGLNIDNFALSPLIGAISNCHFDCVRLLHSLGATIPPIEDDKLIDIISQSGSIDIYEYLLLAGLDTRCVDSRGYRAHDYLCFSNYIDWGIFERTLSPTRAIEMTRNKMSLFSSILGVGSVKKLPDEATKLPKSVTDQVSKLTDLPFINIGSSAEETKVGFPDEVDLMVKRGHSKNTRNDLRQKGHGYVRIDSIQQHSNSKEFHVNHWIRMSSGTKSPVEDDMEVVSYPKAVAGGGAACTPLTMRWKPKDGLRSIVVSVDMVPLLPVDDWPDDAVQKTWWMDNKTLKSWGYQLVAKPPHKDSSFGKEFKEADHEREKLYRVTFSELEVEHFKNLEDRVKDVYILAKCLRNPVACRVVVRDENEVIHFTSKFITSYLLKTVFLHNVEDFLHHQRPLIEMVYIIYSQLEYYLSHGFLPVFWMPKINTLEGINLNAAQSHKVAAHMKSILEDAYKDELNKDPPQDVNDACKRMIPDDCTRIELRDARKIRIISVPLKENDIKPLFTPLHSACQTSNEVISILIYKRVTETSALLRSIPVDWYPIVSQDGSMVEDE